MIWKKLLYTFGVAKFLPPETATQKLSSAIRVGHELIDESKISYRLCAIGAGYYAKTGKYLNSADAPMLTVANEFNVPYRVVQEASCKHFAGMPRLEVANWLEKQGY